MTTLLLVEETKKVWYLNLKFSQPTIITSHHHQRVFKYDLLEIGSLGSLSHYIFPEREERRVEEASLPYCGVQFVFPFLLSPSQVPRNFDSQRNFRILSISIC